MNSLIAAVLLGDGYITMNHGKPILGIQHGDSQCDYLNHKLSLFVNLGYQPKIHRINKSPKRHFIAHRMYILCDEVNYWKTMFYPFGKKVVTENILNCLDDQGLAIWWMDDGCLSVYTNPTTKSTQRYGKLCTHSFSLEENIIIQKFLKNKWDLDVRIKKEKNKYNFIYFNATSLNKLIKIIKPHVIQSLSYKIDMKYKGGEI